MCFFQSEDKVLAVSGMCAASTVAYTMEHTAVTGVAVKHVTHARSECRRRLLAIAPLDSHYDRGHLSGVS